MKLKIPCALALLAGLVGAPALAQDAAEKEPAPGGEERGRKAREHHPRSADAATYTFEDDLVRGDTVAPSLEVLTVRTREARESLIRVREHFVVELLQSVEQL